MSQLLGLLVFVLSFQASADVPVHEDRNEAEYNYQYAVVLDGYDPVSYFAEGGGVATQGDASISFTYGTRVYHFSSAENLALFKANPLKYEPTYGSYCAYGMANGAKIEIKPTVYTLSGNRLHFFINKNAKKNFDADVQDHEDRADQFFFEFSGEMPRK